jgi:hypothetical protein
MTKIIQLMMVLAVFNPFCCCTAGVFAAHTAEPATVTHSCCQSQASEGEAPGSDDSNNGHNSSECPHKALKDYQASIDKDHSAAPHASGVLPALLTFFDLVLFEPVVQTSPSVGLATISHAPPLSIAQVYCVYTI